MSVLKKVVESEGYEKGEIVRDCMNQPVEVMSDTGDGVPNGYTLVKKHNHWSKLVYPTILPTRERG